MVLPGLMTERSILQAKSKDEQPAGRIELPLTTGPATGYAWTLELPAGISPSGRRSRRARSAGQDLGGASHASLRVQADAGTSRVVARLARPWGAGSPARR